MRSSYVLRSRATVGGLAAASTVLPVNLRKALAAPRSSHGSLRDIKHVVMLMQENRSFDHYFGSLPYRLNTLISAAQALPQNDHGWAVQHLSWNNGKMDNWLPAHRAADGNDVGPYVMGYFTREDIPFQYALADAFTILDSYHCSVLGPTGPNRYMWMAGTIDPDGLAGGPSLTTSAPNGQYTFTTYPERLTEAGASWRIYHDDGPVTGLAAIQHITRPVRGRAPAVARGADRRSAHAAPGAGQAPAREAAAEPGIAYAVPALGFSRNGM